MVNRFLIIITSNHIQKQKIKINTQNTQYSLIITLWIRYDQYDEHYGFIITSIRLIRSPFTCLRC